MTTSPPASPTGPLSRRQALLWIGGAGVALIGAACSSTASKIAASASTSTTADAAGTTSTSTTAASTATTAAATAAAPSCVLTPEMTEGPYYLSGEAIRNDITDGMPGVPLTLVLTVADASTCTPIKDATVEIWHADATGDYSGFGNGASSRTFLRGGQVSDAGGEVTFRTIYPGWYQGRATHIHLKVHVGSTVHTTQLFFDEAVNDAVYAKAPYSSHVGTRTRNSQDGIFSGGGTLTPAATAAGYTGAISLGVQR